MAELIVRMVPGVDATRSGESGIITIIREYAKRLPEYGIKFVDGDTEDYDLFAVHAGMIDKIPPPDKAVLAINHGLYWTAEYQSAAWEYGANLDVINTVRHAHLTTVPSKWVQEVFQRDMHFSPTIVPHGVDLAAWENHEKKGGYVIGYAKNRAGQDVCNTAYLDPLAKAFPGVNFLSTFAANEPRENVKVTGVLPYQEMMRAVKRASLYISCTKETFGIGILEAMAAGLPILGWHSGGICDLVEHGVNGYLAEPQNYEDLYEGLRYCIQYQKALGANGREMSSSWTWDAACQKMAWAMNEAVRLKHEPPTVSIIIPSYRYAEKVGRAIQSAIDQTYPMISEILVVDDCSPDDGATGKAVEAFSQKDPRVKYLRLDTNSGVAVARNAGISATTGKYIVCMDADDAISPPFVERCVPALEADQSLGIAFTSLKILVPGKGEFENRWPPDSPKYDQQLLGHNQVPTCCMFRRMAWERTGGYRKRYAPEGCGSEDAELWLRMGAQGWGYRKVTTERLFTYSFGGSTARRDYREPEWRGWHPWVNDLQFPFASQATASRQSHPVRYYDEPSISVVIPVGPNHENSVVDALDSLEAQSFRKWEAIVVWDNPVPVPVRLRNAYPWVRWILTPKTPMGAGAARNLGVKQARAKFLVFLDADDYLLPLALESFVLAWRDDPAVVYGNCLAIAQVDDVAALDSGMRANIVDRNTKTGRTTVRFRAAEYDCQLAQKQPVVSDNMADLYLWAHVTSFIPKSWHDDIGGFDETMPSWEDVDYHWRLARAGRCYRKIDVDTFVYSLQGGERRQYGLQKSSDLIQYLLNKYKELQTSMCSGGCGKGKIPPPVHQMAGGRIEKKMSDEDVVLCRYMSENIGQHDVTGAATHEKYGRRAGGGAETFLVRRQDVAAQPALFQVVSPVPSPVSQETSVKPLAPPVDVAGLLRKTDAESPGVFDPGEPIGEDTVQDAPEGQKEFDVASIAGVTPGIAQQLRDLGWNTPEAIVEAGVTKLKGLKGVGNARADIIFKSANDLVTKPESE